MFSIPVSSIETGAKNRRGGDSGRDAISGLAVSFRSVLHGCPKLDIEELKSMKRGCARPDPFLAIGVDLEERSGFNLAQKA